MTLDAILAGVGALLAAAFGVVLLVREFRRRDRRESLREIEELTREVHALRADLLSYRRWSYGLATTLAGLGVAAPPAPPPAHADDQVEP